VEEISPKLIESIPTLPFDIALDSDEIIIKRVSNSTGNVPDKGGAENISIGDQDGSFIKNRIRQIPFKCTVISPEGEGSEDDSGENIDEKNESGDSSRIFIGKL
jgi:hypothetical protein